MTTARRNTIGAKLRAEGILIGREIERERLAHEHDGAAKLGVEPKTLTRADVKAMSANQINERWPEVAAVLESKS